MKAISWKQISVLTGLALTVNMAWADDTTANANNNNTVNNMNPPASFLAVPLTAQKFVTDASMCGMKEVYVSQLALQKSSNEDVKDFANRMIKDHTSANNKLAKIAQEEGYATPATNAFSATDPNWSNDQITRAQNAQDATLKGQQAEQLISTNMPYLADYLAVQQLQNTPADQFDRVYLEGMITDHTMAINEFTSASQTLSDPKLKKFADKTLTTLHKHADLAHELNDKLGNQNARNDNNTSAPTASNLPMNP